MIAVCLSVPSTFAILLLYYINYRMSTPFCVTIFPAIPSGLKVSDPTKAAQHTSTTASATHSEGEKMSEIQSLTLRVQSLIHSVDWWNTAMIWGLALAAIAA